MSTWNEGKWGQIRPKNSVDIFFSEMNSLSFSKFFDIKFSDHES